MVKFAPIAFALLLAASSGGTQAQKPATVSLKFAWPPGLSAEVSSTKTRTRVTTRRTESTATMRYTVTAQADGNNLRIHFADPKLEMSGDTLPATAQAQMFAQVAELIPDYVVSRSGEFVRIHDLPTYQNKVQALLQKILPQGADPNVLAQIQKLVTSEAFLNSKAAEQWNAMVGTWVGADFELGERYAHSTQEPVAMFPGQQVQMNYTFTAKRLLKCTRGGVERTCAEVEMRSMADPEDTRRLIEAFLKNLAGRAPQAPVLRGLEIESVLVLVTEPDGLIPHTSTLTRTVRSTVSVGEREQQGEQVDVTQTSYQYR